MGEVGCSSEHTLPTGPRQLLSKIESHLGICFKYVQAVRSDMKLDRCQEGVLRRIEARLVALVRRGAPRIGPPPPLASLVGSGTGTEGDAAEPARFATGPRGGCFPRRKVALLDRCRSLGAALLSTASKVVDVNVYYVLADGDLLGPLNG